MFNFRSLFKEFDVNAHIKNCLNENGNIKKAFIDYKAEMKKRPQLLTDTYNNVLASFKKEAITQETLLHLGLLIELLDPERKNSLINSIPERSDKLYKGSEVKAAVLYFAFNIYDNISNENLAPKQRETLCDKLGLGITFQRQDYRPEVLL